MTRGFLQWLSRCTFCNKLGSRLRLLWLPATVLADVIRGVLALALAHLVRRRAPPRRQAQFSSQARPGFALRLGDARLSLRRLRALVRPVHAAPLETLHWWLLAAPAARSGPSATVNPRPDFQWFRAPSGRW